MPLTSLADRRSEAQPEPQPQQKAHRLRQLAGLLAIAALALLSACGASNVTPPAITVAFTPGFTPPTAMTVSEQCGVAATVTNDSRNQGVKWVAACGSASCGTFTPTAASASATPITYTSPAAIPSGSTVTLTATSVTDPTKNVSSAPITIGATSSGCAAP
jgi:hypothetical protein